MLNANPLDPYPKKPKPLGQPDATDSTAPALARPAIAAPKPAPESPLARLNADVGANQASQSRVNKLQDQQRSIPIAAPLIVPEGRSGMKPMVGPMTNATVRANMAIGQRVSQEQAQQVARVPALQQNTALVRQQAAQDRATAVAGQANRLLVGAGVAPAPVISRPDFSNVTTGFSTRQAPVARTASQLEQASLDEVVARHEVNGPGATGGAIAAPAASGYFEGSNGVRKTVNPDGSITGSNHTVAISRPGAGASADQAAGVGFRPQVPSTFGLSANDPRLDDQQTAIARPTGSFRGPDAMSEHYANKEDREAARALAGNLDTDVFRASFAAGRKGREGRQAQEQIASLRAAQAALLSGQAQLSGGAVQGRENRDNRLQITDAEQQGQDRRTDAQIRLGDRNAANAYGMALLEDNTKRTAIAADIARPQYTTDQAGRYVAVSGASAKPVVDENGNPMLARPDKVNGGITPALQYEQASTELRALLNNPPLADDPAYNQQLQAVRANLSALAASGQGTPAPEAVQHLQANPQLAADFDAKYGQGASKRYLENSAAKTAVNRSTGERIQFNPQTNSWEPLR